MPSQHKDTLQAGAQITRDNYHWGAGGGASTSVSFGFHTSAAGYTVQFHDISVFSPFTAAEQAATRAAMQLWSSIANISFTDLGNTNSATILFANYRDF